MPLSQRPTADKEPEKLWARDWVRTADQGGAEDSSARGDFLCI